MWISAPAFLETPLRFCCHYIRVCCMCQYLFRVFVAFCVFVAFFVDNMCVRLYSISRKEVLHL
nr:MAG TPA: conotoxin [Caudoviricetes sp.]